MLGAKGLSHGNKIAKVTTQVLLIRRVGTAHAGFMKGTKSGIAWAMSLTPLLLVLLIRYYLL